VNKRLSLSLVGGALLLLCAEASAECENMVVIVRNSVYPINGLDAFCKEFNQMKAQLASMKSALSAAHEENAMLRERLAPAAGSVRDDSLAQANPAERTPQPGSAVR
jgi:hypothetical protein